MGDFFRIGMEWTTGFITGITSFWEWFINPILEIGDFVVAPYMILSFAVLIVIFGLALGHLLNPLG